jgi:hypothetical protein
MTTCTKHTKPVPGSTLQASNHSELTTMVVDGQSVEVCCLVTDKMYI